MAVTIASARVVLMLGCFIIVLLFGWGLKPYIFMCLFFYAFPGEPSLMYIKPIVVLRDE
jgi:hypothetical protein